jgi:RTA1 like protein
MVELGGGIMASGTLSAVNNGAHIVVGGLVVQILFFGFFIVTATVFHTRLMKLPTGQSISLGLWRKHVKALYAASCLIMIRSVFRVVEYAMGNDGYLMRHEAFLYVFDGVLMLSVMVLYNFIHPDELKRALDGSQGNERSRGHRLRKRGNRKQENVLSDV